MKSTRVREIIKEEIDLFLNEIGTGTETVPSAMTNVDSALEIRNVLEEMESTLKDHRHNIVRSFELSGQNDPRDIEPALKTLEMYREALNQLIETLR